MSEMDDDELAYTREHHTHAIRKKNLMDCNEKELRIRCSFDERYIKYLEKRVKELEPKKKEKKDKNEMAKLKKEWEDR